MASAAPASFSENPLSELILKASARRKTGCVYAGDILPVEAYDYLAREGGMLVDVRTVPEWQFVGVPSLEGCCGTLAMICWKNYPDMAENPNFVQGLAETGAAKDTPLFFMCRAACLTVV